MANRDILKEAIADAKAVKETAIANAKIALEETFAPYLREKLAAKLAEMDTSDDGEEEMETDDLENTTSNDDAYEKAFDKMDEEKDFMDEEVMDETKKDEFDLDELLRELDDMDDMDEVINDPRGQGSHGNVAPSSESDTDLMEGKEEEEFDIEDMSEGDLKDFIEGVIADMVKDGELEAGHEGMEGEEEEEEEVDLNELMDDLSEKKSKDLKSDAYYEKHDAGNKASKFKRGLAKFKDSSSDAYYEKHEKMKEELEEAYSTIAKIKSEINEVNLLNSKLLYANKVFKSKNLTESQKVKVLAAFDKAASKKEAQLVYETVMENLGTLNTPKRPVTESIRGMASRVISGASNTKQPIIEVNSAFERMQKLAGIRK
jgi:hypothetical protein